MQSIQAHDSTVAMATGQPAPKPGGSAWAGAAATPVSVLGTALLAPHFIAPGCVPPPEVVVLTRDASYCLHVVGPQGLGHSLLHANGAPHCGQDSSQLQVEADRLNDARATAWRQLWTHTGVRQVPAKPRQFEASATCRATSAARPAAPSMQSRSEIEAAAARVSAVLIHVMPSINEHAAIDASAYALLGQELLKDLGVDSQVIVGSAGWRVGGGDSDVISHHAALTGVRPDGVTRAYAYHAWLQVGNLLIDFTTHQLRTKAATLDSIDGGTTTVDWAPDYLVAELPNGHTVRSITQSFDAGVFFYERNPRLETTILASARLSDEALNAARVRMANPSVRILNVNHLRPEGD